MDVPIPSFFLYVLYNTIHHSLPCEDICDVMLYTIPVTMAHTHALPASFTQMASQQQMNFALFLSPSSILGCSCGCRSF